MSAFGHLLDQLDLQAHVAEIESFLSRKKPLYIEGDQGRHYQYIRALDTLEFPAPPKTTAFDTILIHLKKQGVLSFEQIFELIKVVRYFRTLRNRGFEGIIGEWMASVVVPDSFKEVERHFDEKGNFKEELDEELFAIAERIKAQKGDIAGQMKRLLYADRLRSYLVDTQVHYVNDEECLLVRGGFGAVLKGSVVGRTGAGFFYVTPDTLLKSKEQIRALTQERDARYYEYAKGFSAQLRELQPFIGFIDKEFDRLDHYQARVLFARAKGLHIVAAQPGEAIVLDAFEHPALSNPKPVSLDFSASVLMITGVNAGGKTMLLKSILSAALMAKYLLPMKLNPHRSRIGSFKQIEAVIDDPQNVRNDISTFAGRMQQFSRLFERKSALVGVDEIELGTDSDEAAALFKVILDDLIRRGQKIVVTTHHKRLASLMADRDDVELVAAVYDEERRVPTYDFLQGIIGKSYAFETALRYGIAQGIVGRAKAVYGEQHEKLNLLIERGSELERELRRKHADVDERLERLEERERALKDERESLRREYDELERRLRGEFRQAIDSAKAAAKAGDTAAIHRAMNAANKQLPEKREAKQKTAPVTLNVGDEVKYRKQRGVIVALKEKEATIEVEGMRLRVRRNELKPAGKAAAPTPKVQVSNKVEKRSGLKLDLHGMRAEQAREKMDVFLSDALIQGWDEVIIYHGIGTGKLAYAVKEFLKQHPSVKGFEDAPPQLGGFGAKIVHL
ncbi:endonuclease MutS2 [Thiomicrolovo sp. ZZH C-3]